MTRQKSLAAWGVATALAGGVALAQAQSGSVWGTPLAGAEAASAPEPAASSTTLAVKPRPSAFATARARNSTATGEYFHDFGELIVRVHSVKWIEEICSEAFPATAEVNEHAYDEWRMNYGRFIDEMEGQFAVIDTYWLDASAKVRAEGYDGQRLRDKVDANRAGLAEDFRARGAASFQRRCEAYPEILLSPQLDLEKSQADYVTSVRLGPR